MKAALLSVTGSKGCPPPASLNLKALDSSERTCNYPGSEVRYQGARSVWWLMRRASVPSSSRGEIHESSLACFQTTGETYGKLMETHIIWPTFLSVCRLLIGGEKSGENNVRVVGVSGGSMSPAPGPAKAQICGAPHPHRAALFIKLLAWRYPVLSHFFSRGLAADGRTNTVILSGRQLERGNYGITRCPSFVKLFLWAVGGDAAGEPNALGPGLFWWARGGGHRFQPQTQAGSARCSVLLSVCC